MEILLDYWNKRRSKLKFLIRTPKRKFSQKRFHALRVELKKLKAFLLLLGFGDADFEPKKFHKPFRTLFSQAGKVRELQIEKEIVKVYGQNQSIPAFLKSLDQKIRKERGVFFANRNLKLNSVLEKRLKSLKPQVKNLKKVDFAPYFKNLLEEIEGILAVGKLEDSTGHLLRKKLKTLKYTLESIRKPSSSAVPPALEELVSLLGNWHDLIRVNELLLEELESSPIEAEELIAIHQIRQKITVAIQELVVEINRKIPILSIS
jgi:CHAD domain-containing protein